MFHDFNIWVIEIEWYAVASAILKSETWMCSQFAHKDYRILLSTKNV